MIDRYRAKCGEHISSAAKNAIKKAKKEHKRIVLEFNGFMIDINPDSYYEDICCIYDLKRRLFYSTAKDNTCYG